MGQKGGCNHATSLPLVLPLHGCCTQTPSCNSKLLGGSFATCSSLCFSEWWSLYSGHSFCLNKTLRPLSCLTSSVSMNQTASHQLAIEQSRDYFRICFILEVRYKYCALSTRKREYKINRTAKSIKYVNVLKMLMSSL